MKIFIYILLFFLMAATLLSQKPEILFSKWGTQNYWDNHGLLFLVFVTIFPRLTLLFSSVPFGGLFWWLGFFFAPRILVAVLATLSYWQQNPVLVAISWAVALSGETGEKYIFKKRVHFVNRNSRRSRTVGDEPLRDESNQYAHKQGHPSQRKTIDVDYKRIDN